MPPWTARSSIPWSIPSPAIEALMTFHGGPPADAPDTDIPGLIASLCRPALMETARNLGAPLKGQ